MELGYVPTLCFVAGIGVTPLVAGCRALDPSQYNASIYVDYSGHVSDELAYVAELSAIDGVALSCSRDGHGRSAHGARCEAAGLVAARCKGLYSAVPPPTPQTL